MTFLWMVMVIAALITSVFQTMVLRYPHKIGATDKWIYTTGSCYAWLGAGPVLALVLTIHSASSFEYIGTTLVWLACCFWVWRTPQWWSARN